MWGDRGGTLLTTEEQKELLDILIATDKWFKRHNIPYWLDGGTLLCLYRDRSLLNEHDLDVGIYGEDLIKVKSLIKEYEATTPFLMQAFDERLQVLVYKQNREHALDIISWHTLDDKVKSCLGMNLQWTMPKELFDNFSELEFNGYKFPIPTNTEEYLTRYFGKNWKTPVNSGDYMQFQISCTKDLSLCPEVNKNYPKHNKLWMRVLDSEPLLSTLGTLRTKIPMVGEAGIPIKINAGCGDMILKGYINIDLYSEFAEVKADIAHLPYRDNYADEIYSSHTIEHFNFKEAFSVLRDWHRVLKPGGIIVIDTPDMLASCKKFVEGDEHTRVGLYSHFFSEP